MLLKLLYTRGSLHNRPDGAGVAFSLKNRLDTVRLTSVQHVQLGGVVVPAANIRLDESQSGMSPESRPGPYVVITVKDTGTGMTPELRARIFDPFFTTKSLDKGTGLGLSTVISIIKDHDGFLIVNSEVGEGTEFKVYLPAQPDAAAPVADAEQPALPLGNGEWILVVDDEASIRNITTQTLEMFGYHVVTARDGSDGLSVYMQHKDRLELVITDIVMPVMDGPAMVRVLQNLAPRLKIIAASGASDSTDNSKEPGWVDWDAFIQKPYSADELLRTVHLVLNLPSKGAG